MEIRKRPPKNYAAYKKYVETKLNSLRTIFANASIGDFSKDVELPEKEDEFTETFVGIEIMLEVIRDKIADFSQVNEKLEDKVEEVQSILKSVGDGLIVLDPLGKIVMLNQEGARMIGWRTQEALGRPFTEVIIMENLDGYPVKLANQSFEELLTEKKKISFDYFFVRPDKTKFPAAVIASPIIIRGKMTGVVIVFRDITKLREVDLAKSEFISIASHQLRTPLTAIGWYAESLLGGTDGPLRKAQREKLDEIWQAKERMVKLVNSLLDISRLELGTYRVKRQPTNLEELAEEALSEQKEKIATKKLKINKNFQKNLPQVDIDPNVIKAVFQNLLSNAIKYTPHGGKIEIAFASLAGKIQIKVADSGLGIPQEEQPKIFTRFFRASNTVGLDPGGAGLGLYIVAEMLKRIKGEITFESRQNFGTTFYVTIPVAFQGRAKR